MQGLDVVLSQHEPHHEGREEINAQHAGDSADSVILESNEAGVVVTGEVFAMGREKSQKWLEDAKRKKSTPLRTGQS